MVSGFVSVMKNIDMNGWLFGGGGMLLLSVWCWLCSVCYSICVFIVSSMYVLIMWNSDRCDVSVFVSSVLMVNVMIV